MTEMSKNRLILAVCVVTLLGSTSIGAQFALQSGRNAVYVNYFVSLLLAFIPAIIGLKILSDSHEPKRSFAIINALFATFAVTLLCVIFAGQVSQWFPSNRVTAKELIAIGATSSETLMLQGVLSINVTKFLISPIVEEIAFRGFLFKLCRQKFTVLVTILATSLLFSLSHLHKGWTHAFVTLFTGLAFGWLRGRFNLFFACLAHIIANSFYFAFAVFELDPVDAVADSLAITLILYAILIASFYALARELYKTAKEI